MSSAISRPALALAAGGARGAYQAGALLYFAESGLRFGAVAGASIGALNAAFYASGDGSPGHIGELIQFWRRFPDANLIRISPQALFDKLQLMFSAATFDWLSVWQSVMNWSPILDPVALAPLLDQVLHYDAICQSSVPLFVAVVEELHPLLDLIIGHARSAEYIAATSLTPDILRSILLAAAAIPALFPSVNVEGRQLADAALADALPAQILSHLGATHIVSVFVSDATIQNRADFPNVAMLQIRPSLAIDDGLWSTLDFSHVAIERLIDLGYSDAQAQHGEILRAVTRIAEFEAQASRVELLAANLPRRV